MTHTYFKLDVLTQSLWRTTFNNPPMNLIDVKMIAKLRELFARMRAAAGPGLKARARKAFEQGFAGALGCRARFGRMATVSPPYPLKIVTQCELLGESP
jgi:hypothetical protein